MLTRRKFVSKLAVGAAAAGIGSQIPWHILRLVPTMDSKEDLGQMRISPDLPSTIVLTEGAPQAGLLFTANLLKHYYSSHGYSHLRLNNEIAGVQIPDQKGVISDFQKLRDEHFSLDKKFVSLSIQYCSEFEPIFKNASVIVVQPTHVRQAFWRYAVYQQIGKWTRPYNSRPLEIAENSIQVSHHAVKKFKLRCSQAQTICAATNVRTVALDPELDSFHAAAERVLSALNIPDRQNFLSHFDLRHFYSETRYSRSPVSLIANRNEVERWLDEAGIPS